MCPENLWGDLKGLKTVRTPAALLREQAQILTESTEGLLIGSVGSTSSGWGPSAFAWDLDVRVPSLNDYAITLLTVEHPAELYPLHQVWSQLARISETATPNEEQLKAVLGKILSSEPVRKVLGALLSQAQS